MRKSVFLSVAAIAVSGLLGSVAAQNIDGPAAPTHIWQTLRGGQLYDKWWEVTLGDEPVGTHPSYPAEGAKSGVTTWRCKECHGWDYEGAAGAYGSGSHYTGIPGITGMAGAPVEDIVAILRGDTHGFTEDMLSDQAIRELALFVSEGQIDTDLYIDRDTRLARGNPANGARHFQNICAVCHGFDGKLINFGDEEEAEYIGTIANENPWEILHKMRSGNPGVGMVALGSLDLQILADILAYAQTLPRE